MARGEAGRGSTRKHRAPCPKAGMLALITVMTIGQVVLSGCAGLATNSNANPAPQEAVQISPSSLEFSNVPVGQQVTRTAVLTNTSNQSISVTQLSLSSPEFTTSGMATPLTLGPGQSTMFQVSFRSSTSGTVSGTLSAMTAHGGGSTKVKLNGNSARTASQLSLSTTSLKYGNVLVDGSATQAVTLKNSGQTDIQISQIGISGTGFSMSGVAVPMTLSAGQSTALQATFAPKAAGPVSGGITITSDAQATSSSIALSGTGVSATYTMSLTPGSVSFGNINVGSKASQTVQLANTGNSSITVTQVAASGAGVSVSGASVPLTLASSQSVPLTVTFAPGVIGPVSGSITVTNSDGVNTVAAVTGSGVQASLSVTPASADFGSVVTGSTNSQTFQLKNSGTASLTVSGATVTGAGFSLSGLSLPLTLAPGQSGNFNVQYAPQSAGAVNGSISIASNAPNSPLAVSLSATGVAATHTLSVSPNSLSFGSVTDGSTVSKSFTVTNTGNANVSISGMTVSGSSYSLASGGGSVTLSPNQSTSASVQFAPTTTGTANGSVTIASNATSSATAVSLSGSGVAPTVSHTIALNWAPSSSTVSGYNLYRSSVSGGSYSKVNASLIGGFNYSDGTVQSGQTYYYVATAVDSSGNESAYSNEVTAIVP